MTAPRLMAFLVLGLTVTFVLSPLFSNGFSGFTPSQFPLVQDHWPVQPVPWAFSIWGVIYVLLFASAVTGALRHATDPDWRPMRGPLAVSLGIGTFWIAVANRQPVIATAMIIYMAAAAVVAMLRAPRSPLALGAAGLYAGWLTAASGVAIAVVLGGYGVISAQVAAILSILVVIVFAGAVQWHRPSAIAYSLGVGWALMGIIVANLSPANLPVVGLAALGIATLATIVLLRRRITA